MGFVVGWMIRISVRCRGVRIALGGSALDVEELVAVSAVGVFCVRGRCDGCSMFRNAARVSCCRWLECFGGKREVIVGCVRRSEMVSVWAVVGGSVAGVRYLEGYMCAVS